MKGSRTTADCSILIGKLAFLGNSLEKRVTKNTISRIVAMDVSSIHECSHGRTVLVALSDRQNDLDRCDADCLARFVGQSTYGLLHPKCH